MNIDEVVKVISDLNERVEYVEGISEMIHWSVITDGNCIAVKYLGSYIWSSEDDEREFFDADDDWEPLETFLIRTQNEFIENIVKHRLVSEPTPDIQGTCPLECKGCWKVPCTGCGTSTGPVDSSVSRRMNRSIRPKLLYHLNCEICKKPIWRADAFDVRCDDHPWEE